MNHKMMGIPQKIGLKHQTVVLFLIRILMARTYFVTNWETIFCTILFADTIVVSNCCFPKRQTKLK